VEEKLPGEWSERKVPTPKEKELVSTARVEKYHLDSNGHMNNQYYINFALSAIEETSNINRIRVSYKQQVVLGEEIGIYLGKDVANTVTLEKDDRICAVVCFN
jgi:acyl-ACP thioesterase